MINGVELQYPNANQSVIQKAKYGPKNLNASSKIHKHLFGKLKDKRIYQIYNKFKKNLNLNNNFTVAVSGGADSLALLFSQKFIQLKKSLKVKYFLVDHKLRSNSSVEALFVKNLKGFFY